MARPELPIGTWGKIRIQKLGPNRFRARARFRDYDGKTRDIEATDTTGPAAERALKVRLRDRTTPNDDEITRETRVSMLSDLWVEEITAEERIAPQTIQRYETSTRNPILPALGNLRIREASVGRLDRFLRDIAKDWPSAAKGAKVVLSQMFALPFATARSPPTPYATPAGFVNLATRSSPSPMRISRPSGRRSATGSDRFLVSLDHGTAAI